MPISVLIADDHDVMRETVRRMLAAAPDIVVVAEASDGGEAVALAAQFHPDVALIDIGMKGVNGIEATTQLLRHSPQTAVLILTVYQVEQYVIRSVAAGARGYLLKESLDDEELLRAIHVVRNGGRFFSQAIADAVPQAFRSASDPV